VRQREMLGWAVEIDVSTAAARFTAGRGGRLYVWFAPVGRGPWSVQRVGFRAPAGVDFTSYPFRSIDVNLQGDFNPPEGLFVRRRPWPIGPIEVTGTGAGDASNVGGTGGGGWGNWPTHHHGGGGGGGGGGHGGHGWPPEGARTTGSLRFWAARQ